MGRIFAIERVRVVYYGCEIMVSVVECFRVEQLGP